MTGTEALDLHNAVVRAYLDGKEEDAAELYFNKVLPYLMFYMDHSKELLKGMLYRRGIITCPQEILPHKEKPMSAVKAAEFEWVLERIGFYRDAPDII